MKISRTSPSRMTGRNSALATAEALDERGGELGRSGRDRHVERQLGADHVRDAGRAVGDGGQVLLPPAGRGLGEDQPAPGAPVLVEQDRVDLADSEDGQQLLGQREVDRVRVGRRKGQHGKAPHRGEGVAGSRERIGRRRTDRLSRGHALRIGAARGVLDAGAQESPPVPRRQQAPGFCLQKAW